MTVCFPRLFGQDDFGWWTIEFCGRPERYKASDIGCGKTKHQIDVQREPRMSVNDRGEAARHHVLDVRAIQWRDEQ